MTLGDDDIPFKWANAKKSLPSNRDGRIGVVVLLVAIVVGWRVVLARMRRSSRQKLPPKRMGGQTYEKLSCMMLREKRGEKNWRGIYHR
jgi:hypothetical protein